MLTWTKLFATGIFLVDTQHQRLFELINQFSESFATGGPSQKEVEQALAELVIYADQHFVDEELIMASHHLDPRHIRLHRMEHQSFMYDVKRLHEHLRADENASERAQGLIHFVASWLVYHTLRTDIVMATQIHAIESGMAPAKAFETHHEPKHDAVITLKVLNAVIDLWRDSAQRCKDLEQRLANSRSRD